jgi:hypothetical protein
MITNYSPMAAYYAMDGQKSGEKKGSKSFVSRMVVWTPRAVHDVITQRNIGIGDQQLAMRRPVKQRVDNTSPRSVRAMGTREKLHAATNV